MDFVDSQQAVGMNNNFEAKNESRVEEEREARFERELEELMKALEEVVLSKTTDENSGDELPRNEGSSPASVLVGVANSPSPSTESPVDESPSDSCRPPYTATGHAPTSGDVISGSSGRAPKSQALLPEAARVARAKQREKAVVKNQSLGHADAGRASWHAFIGRNNPVSENVAVASGTSPALPSGEDDGFASNLPANRSECVDGSPGKGNLDGGSRGGIFGKKISFGLKKPARASVVGGGSGGAGGVGGSGGAGAAGGGAAGTALRRHTAISSLEMQKRITEQLFGGDDEDSEPEESSGSNGGYPPGYNNNFAPRILGSPAKSGSGSHQWQPEQQLHLQQPPHLLQQPPHLLQQRRQG
ncbi:unnamed protein product [Closterium sp. NIES-53]